MSLRKPLGAALLAAVLLPSAASAATISQEGDTLVYRAAPGEQNTVYLNDSWNPEGKFRFDGPTVITAWPASCESRDESMVDCAMPARVRVELGDGDDAFGWMDDQALTIPVEVHGGDGSDRLHGNHKADVAETLDGGAGKDGIDGFGGDDTVRGGAGDDVLEGNGGNDTVLGEDGNDELNGDDQAAPGADVVDGGAGNDIMKDYVEYGTDIHPPASVSLDGAANDGRAGEGDNVTNVERYIAYVSGDFVLTDGAEDWQVWSNMNSGASTVNARGGDDKVTGGDAQETIDGGAGNDRLEGGKGHDTITGGPGTDTIFGDETTSSCKPDFPESCVRYGNDTILARDGEADQIDCGAGTDKAVVDALDVVGPSCETVEREAAAPQPGTTPRTELPATGQPNPTKAAAPKVALAGPAKLRAALRKGLVVRLRAAKAGKARIVARSGGRIVASARVKVAANGTATVKLRFTGKARRTLARKRSVRLTISGAGVSGTVTLAR